MIYIKIDKLNKLNKRNQALYQMIIQLLMVTVGRWIDDQLRSNAVTVAVIPIDLERSGTQIIRLVRWVDGVDPHLENLRRDVVIDPPPDGVRDVKRHPVTPPARRNVFEIE